MGGYIYIPYDEKRSTVAGRTQRTEEEQRVEYRECPSFVGSIAGSDGSICKGYLDEPRQHWKRMTVRANGQILSVWITADEEQCRIRVAVLVLDAWGGVLSIVVDEDFIRRRPLP